MAPSPARPAVTLTVAAMVSLAGCAMASASPSLTRASAPATESSIQPDPLPTMSRSFLFTPDNLSLSRELVNARDPEMLKARDTIIAQAEIALAEPIVPVTDGKSGGARTAPSGDPRDYVSLSPYWWPNPDTDDGLPFVRRDGQINPDRALYDANKLGDFGTNVHALAMGYLVTGDERFAARAAEHLRAWFITPETRMVPRIAFGQFVPGLSEGRKGGIIETNRIRFTADSIEIIASSPSWTDSDHEGAQQWYSDYLDWLLTSELGKAERASENNHGTWYATQCAQYALFAGREDIAREMVNHGFERVRSQIEPDGSMPHELERTVALDYTCFNLRALMDLATYGQSLGIDLMHYSSGEGQSIENGVRFALPYVTGEQEWPYQQIKPTRFNNYNQLFRMAARQFNEPAFDAAIDQIPELADQDQWMAYAWPRDPELR